MKLTAKERNLEYSALCSYCHVNEGIYIGGAQNISIPRMVLNYCCKQQRCVAKALFLGHLQPGSWAEYVLNYREQYITEKGLNKWHTQ